MGFCTTVAVQPGTEQFRLGLLKLGSRVVEAVFLEALERGAFQPSQRELRVRLGTAGCTAREPLGVNVRLALDAGFQHRGIIGIDFEPVGLDGLYVQDFVETAAAHLEIRVPVSSRVGGAGGNVVGKETVLSGAHHAGVELPFRGVELQGGRVSGREALAFVAQEHVYMQGVAGPPYAALAVNEGLEPFPNGFTAHVEAAQGAFVVLGGFKVGRTAARPGHDSKRLVRQRKGGQALSIRLSLAHALELVVVHLQLGAGQGLAGQEVRCGNPQLSAFGIFRHQADVGSKQLHYREAVAVHVIGRFGGIVGLFPVVKVPVIVVVPVVGTGFVPDGVVYGRRLPGGSGRA